MPQPMIIQIQNMWKLKDMKIRMSTFSKKDSNTVNTWKNIIKKWNLSWNIVYKCPETKIKIEWQNDRQNEGILHNKCPIIGVYLCLKKKGVTWQQHQPTIFWFFSHFHFSMTFLAFLCVNSSMIPAGGFPLNKGTSWIPDATQFL